jgi:hypothetical protein
VLETACSLRIYRRYELFFAMQFRAIGTMADAPAILAGLRSVF